MTVDEVGSVRVEASPKRVRILFAGVMIADTRQARLVWERPAYPTYYIPEEDVRMGVLADSGEVDRSSTRGSARVMGLTVGDRHAPSAARWYSESSVAALAGTVRFRWDAMDAWFEEDEEVYVHPRDPYTRVDILQSSRHIRIEVDGVTVAESRQPRLLFETGLPPRIYLPKTDVCLDLLTPTARVTRCPYKGTARYYAVRVGDTVHDDLVWWYRHTTLEASKIAGYLCFYDERIDTYVDGALQPRPSTASARDTDGE